MLLMPVFVLCFGCFLKAVKQCECEGSRWKEEGRGERGDLFSARKRKRNLMPTPHKHKHTANDAVVVVISCCSGKQMHLRKRLLIRQIEEVWQSVSAA